EPGLAGSSRARAGAAGTVLHVRRDALVALPPPADRRPPRRPRARGPPPDPARRDARAPARLRRRDPRREARPLRPPRRVGARTGGRGAGGVGGVRAPRTLELLDWVSSVPRTWVETMDAWASHCPRLLVWEDALLDGLVRVKPGQVVLTPAGEAALAARKDQ